MNRITIVLIFISLLISSIFSYMLAGTKPPEKIIETKYILQKCEPTELDYAKYHLEKQKQLREVCDNGGYFTGYLKTEIKCYEN